MNSQTAAAGIERGLRIAAAPADPGREALLEAARGAAEEVEIVATGSTGQPALEPLVLATVDGRTALLPTPGGEAVRAAVARLADGNLPESAPYVVDHETGTETLPVPDDGPLAVGRRLRGVAEPARFRGLVASFDRRRRERSRRHRHQGARPW